MFADEHVRERMRMPGLRLRTFFALPFPFPKSGEGLFVRGEVRSPLRNGFRPSGLALRRLRLGAEPGQNGTVGYAARPVFAFACPDLLFRPS